MFLRTLFLLILASGSAPGVLCGADTTLNEARSTDGRTVLYYYHEDEPPGIATPRAISCMITVMHKENLSRKVTWARSVHDVTFFACRAIAQVHANHDKETSFDLTTADDAYAVTQLLYAWYDQVIIRHDTALFSETARSILTPLSSMQLHNAYLHAYRLGCVPGIMHALRTAESAHVAESIAPPSSASLAQLIRTAQESSGMDTAPWHTFTKKPLVEHSKKVVAAGAGGTLVATRMAGGISTALMTLRKLAACSTPASPAALLPALILAAGAVGVGQLVCYLRREETLFHQSVDTALEKSVLPATDLYITALGAALTLAYGQNGFMYLTDHERGIRLASHAELVTQLPGESPLELLCRLLHIICLPVDDLCALYRPTAIPSNIVPKLLTRTNMPSTNVVRALDMLARRFRRGNTTSPMQLHALCERAKAALIEQLQALQKSCDVMKACAVGESAGKWSGASSGAILLRYGLLNSNRPAMCT